MEKKSYIVGVDIGSSQVVMTVGQLCDDGTIKVLGIETKAVNDSVKNGSIENVIRLGQAIAGAKVELEKALNIRIQEAYAGISGEAVYCAQYSDHVFVKDQNDGCISQDDLRDLHERMLKVVAGNSDEILERIPQKYTIDDRQDVSDPVGRYGKKLSALYLFLLCNSRQKERVKHAFHNAGLTLLGVCINPAMLPELLLTKDEREYGVAIVDIGCHLTDIAIVHGGHLCYIASLPIGGAVINQDLHSFVPSSKEEIEKIKKKFGAALAEEIPDNLTVTIQPPGRPKKSILQRNVAEITEARARDIVRFVQREIREARFTSKIQCGVVLTGGTALLNEIDELFSREMKCNVRLANELYGIDEESRQNIGSYAQSAAVAILLYGAKNRPCSTIEMISQTTPLRHTPEVKVPPHAEPVEHVVPQGPVVVPTPAPSPSPIPTVEYQEPESKPEPQDIEEPQPIEKEDKREKVSMFGKFSSWLDNIIKGNDDYLT